MMEYLHARKSNKLVFIFMIIIVFSTQFVSVFGDESLVSQWQPRLKKLVTDAIQTWKQPNQSPWDKVKAIANNVQLQFFPPNLDFRSGGQGNAGSTVEKVKEAAEKSTAGAQEAAKQAGGAVGDAVQKTGEEVKKSVSKDEL